jgi:glycyl-tRNA synthetase
MVDCANCKARFRADQLFHVGYYGANQLEQLKHIPQAIQKIRDGNDVGEFAVEDLALLTPANLAPELVFTVEANSREEAINKPAPTRELKRRFPKGHSNPMVAPFTEYPPHWPRLIQCPRCGGGTLSEARQFNLMFRTAVGALEDASSQAYLRPETAQGIFANFKNVLDSSRVKLPFGIAQVGKAFRNEINPRNYTFRSREFEQMEIEFFCHPSESMKWYQYWRDLRKSWYTQLGIKSDRLRPREQGKEELAHYSVGTTDIEYLFPFSAEPQELEGVAHRADYDLKQHMQHSGKDLRYFDEEGWAKADKSAFAGDKKKEQEAKDSYRFLPHVIEPSAGADRFTLAVLCEAYAEDTIGGEARTVMRFHPRLAPIKAAILPLVNKEGMPEIANKLYRQLKTDWNVFYDDGGAIGRRYRRQDEIGTPFCFTIDGQTLQDQTVTLRTRDSAEQVRLPMAGVAGELRMKLSPKQ